MGGEGIFPCYLVPGDNGKVGISLFEYCSENYILDEEGKRRIEFKEGLVYLTYNEIQYNIIYFTALGTPPQSFTSFTQQLLIILSSDGSVYVDGQPQS